MAHMQTTPEEVPVIVLKEGSKQSQGKDAQRNNISAAKLIAEIIQTSLGPRGWIKCWWIQLEILQLQMMVQHYLKTSQYVDLDREILLQLNQFYDSVQISQLSF